MKHRTILVPRLPDYAAELDSLFLVAFSRKRIGNMVLFEQRWRD